MDCTHAGDHCFAGIDGESLKLIIQLQIEDIDHLSSKGKGHANDVSDISVAFKLQRDELEKTASFLSDKCMARNIALAVQADGGILTETILDEEVLQKLQVLYISGVEVKDGSTSVKLDKSDCDLVAGLLPKSSTLAASRPAPPRLFSQNVLAAATKSISAMQPEFLVPAVMNTAALVLNAFLLYQ